MACGRYPMRSAWGMRSRSADQDPSHGTGWTSRHVGQITTLDPRRAGATQGAVIWKNWWLGGDGIVASTVYETGITILKRWDGAAWVPAKLRVHV